MTTKKYLGDTKQNTFEKELKKQWAESSKIRGQLTFSSGAIASKKLKEFGF